MTTFNFLFLPYHNTGGHFCSWSLYYLAGEQQYPSHNKEICNIQQHREITITKNFHHQPSLMIRGHKGLLDVINDPWYQQFNMVNFYTEPLHFYHVIKDHYDVEYTKLSKSQLAEVFDYIVTDAKKMLSEIQNLKHNLFMFEFNPQDLYIRVYNDRHSSSSLNNNPLVDIGERYQDWSKTWFQNIDRCFNDTVWDQREKFALIVEQELWQDWLGKINRQRPHLYYTSDDIWNAMPTIISEMCHYAGFNPTKERLKNWELIYSKWRLNHDPWLSRHIERVVDAIVNNYYLSLERFDLDFYKEVLIQHLLIKKYNLNLKNWQLEKFPLNTQELHKLLEPNIHAV